MAILRYTCIYILSFAEWYCALNAARYRHLVLMHISQYKLINSNYCIKQYHVAGLNNIIRTAVIKMTLRLIELSCFCVRSWKAAVTRIMVIMFWNKCWNHTHMYVKQSVHPVWLFFYTQTPLGSSGRVDICSCSIAIYHFKDIYHRSTFCIGETNETPFYSLKTDCQKEYYISSFSMP